MVRIPRALTAGLTLSVVAASGCIFPTDRSGDLTVEADALPTLLVKDTVEIVARVVDADGTEVPNAVIGYASSDSTVAIVNAEGRLLAVGEGTATISVTAPGFVDAAPATATVTVRGLLEVDSITPRVVRFGSQLTLWGIGLSPELVFSVDVGGEDAPIAGFTPTDPSAPDREGALSVYVKPPSPRGSDVSVLGVNGGVVSSQPIIVQQFDIYEPNDTTPWRFGTKAIANPGAAFEPRGRDDFREATDWYTFTTNGGEDRTIVIGGKGIGSETFSVFVSDSMYSYGEYFGYYIGYNAWTIGPSTYFCGGLSTPDIYEQDFPLATVALRDLPAGEYHVVVFYTPQPEPNAYNVVVAKSYVSVLSPDGSEENDFCDVATPLPTSGTLTIDNPHDPDWYRLTVPSGGRTFSLNVTAADTLADLDVYVYGDFRPDSLPLYWLGFDAGQTESFSVFLDQGDYFVTVIDYPGQPTTYTMSSTLAAPPAGAAPMMQPVSADLIERARASKGASATTGTPRVLPLRSGRR